MNRDIKFRGKSLKYGNWLFGSLWIDGGKFYIIHEKESEKAGENSWYDTYVTEVDPSTVGQYTGLKDKNGTEIYEGDIVTLHSPDEDNEMDFSIAFDNEKKCFGLSTNGGNVLGFSYWSNPERDIYPYLEVIGTIHDRREINK